MKTEQVLGTAFEDEIDALIECLVEAGVIVDREFPESISDNPITTTTTTQSSNIAGPQSSNIVFSTFSSSPSSTLVNILPSNPN